VEGLPDLEGQPAWVVVVVVALSTTGILGSAWLGRRGKRKADEGDKSDAAIETHREGVPSLPSGAAGVLEASVNAIIRDADAGRQEVAETRAEMRKVQHQLVQALTERDDALRRAQRALADLGTCQERVRRLIQQRDGDAV